jgi:hypothetical protein
MKIRLGFVANSSSSDFIDDDDGGGGRTLSDFSRSGKTIYISNRLHNKMIHLRNECGNVSELYMLGANKVGVCTTIVPLTRAGGCDFMPTVRSSDLTNKFLELAKKGLTFGGFGYLFRSGEVPDWEGEAGEGIFDNPGSIFLAYMPDGTSAQIAIGGDVQSVEIAVVPAGYVPPKRRGAAINNKP